VMVFQDGAKLAYVFKKPVSQLEFFAALGEAFGKMGIDMPELEIPEQTPPPVIEIGKISPFENSWKEMKQNMF
ncbi:MAG: hypothetical protein Q8O55_08765, partial [Dehalococcoidales bacterium]|nr:hypothetical protein [Dehalococcoidales bacterium]